MVSGTVKLNTRAWAQAELAAKKHRMKSAAVGIFRFIILELQLELRWTR
ncbi:hypothetical protein D187_002618 [Cystobacter fuscus DSM 2262]|uniref:Uncharacterized protein n=1 Tax=Cystobacter fuscus (strain ATCC 25194 / DSM 2262 / NBRC 100088 / M29) TaxID=1242864 RepID=S9QEW1_CYSF2|nr:hypothetical protein D187_002618 [Cystobacter fuscus DSM 2262]